MGEYKPCPFCESTKINGMFIRDGWRIGCMECGAGVQAYHPEAHKRAADKWNRRDRDAAKDAEIARLREALEDIVSPIAAMQRRANADGSKLDGGMAFMLSIDPEYLRGIARAALKATDE